MSSRGKGQKPSYYVVKVGRVPGIYDTWTKCQTQTQGYKNAVHKKFSSLEEAQKFYSQRTAATHATAVTQSEETKTRDSITIFTDGACSNNGMPGAAAGYGVWFGAQDTRTVTRKANESESRVDAIEGLKAVKLSLPADGVVNLHTDSQYVIKGITNWIHNWKRKNWRIQVENKELWELLDAEREGIAVNWIYVKGHSGVEGNEEADKLAVAGCSLPRPTAMSDSAVADNLPSKE